jgi:hypothetical protein
MKNAEQFFFVASQIVALQKLNCYTRCRSRVTANSRATAYSAISKSAISSATFSDTQCCVSMHNEL